MCKHSMLNKAVSAWKDVLLERGRSIRPDFLFLWPCECYSKLYVGSSRRPVQEEMYHYLKPPHFLIDL